MNLADLTPNWYKVVGRSLATSQFVAAFLRILNLIMRYLTTNFIAGAVLRRINMYNALSNLTL